MPAESVPRTQGETMVRRDGRAFVAVLLVTFALLGAALPAQAAGPARGHTAAEGFWARLLAWMGWDLSWAIMRSSAAVDPNGRPAGTVTPDSSGMIDPNGQPAATITPDYSEMIDPDGAH